jgi:hypothetical protein
MKMWDLLAGVGVALVAVLVLAFVVAPNLGGGTHTSFNVVEVYIGTWDLNKSIATPGIDVMFQISIDFNNDGVYEMSPHSDAFNSTTVLVAPFKIGGPIDSSIGTFTFKVDVFKLVDNSWMPMYYTADATTPLNHGVNQVEATGSWSWDATGLEGANEFACKITYLYYINFVS